MGVNIEAVSPVGRLVQGGITLQDQKDDDDKPKLDSNGQQVKQCFIAVAFPKNDPHFPAFYAQMLAAAKASYPTLFNGDTCNHPGFAMKLQDGDGVDKNGKSVADKPGFAGHWIVKMATQFLPKCYHEGKFDPAQQIPNPEQVIKKGYFVRVACNIRDNGVAANDTKKKPGIFISPTLVSLVAFGEEIVTGPDASKVFGAAGAVTALPPGASATPSVAGAGAMPGVPTPGAMPTVATPATVAVPTPGAMPTVATPTPTPTPTVAVPTPPATVAVPTPPTGPVYAMTPLSQGASREQMLTAGWTDEAMLAQGYMVKIG